MQMGQSSSPIGEWGTCAMGEKDVEDQSAVEGTTCFRKDFFFFAVVSSLFSEFLLQPGTTFSATAPFGP